MNILVCIKQVPGSNKVEVDPVTGVLKRDGVESKMNPYDLYALETALRLVETYGGTVKVISMGPPQAGQIIREAFAMGAEEGILLSDRKFAGADVLATSYTLSQGVREAGEFDLILCGKQTTDGDTAQVGPEMAEYLKIPSVSNVKRIVSVDDDAITVEMTVILVGATNVGRQLAPRVAARFRTGLTADCTVLDIKENTDLVQIRPAFGGNIMAEIHTPNARPQLATVRYKVMNAPERNKEKSGKVTVCDLSNVALESDIKVLDVVPKAKEIFIENADVLVVAGRGVKSQDDLNMIRELADLLGGEVACTRPMIEAGWFDAKKQIGLSGRTVRPKLIITCGVSGSVQFAAGMNNSDMIVAINKDEKAPIFKIAHYGIVGDLYEVLPRLIAKVKAEKGA